MTDTAFYADMAATALELLTDFGAPITLRAAGGVAHDPVTGEVTDTGDVDVVVNGVRTSYEEEYFQGTLVTSGMQFYILDATVKPVRSQKLVNAEGEVLDVLAVEPVSPAGIPVIYKVLASP